MAYLISKYYYPWMKMKNMKRKKMEWEKKRKITIQLWCCTLLLEFGMCHLLRSNLCKPHQSYPYPFPIYILLVSSIRLFPLSMPLYCRVRELHYISSLAAYVVRFFIKDNGTI